MDFFSAFSKWYSLIAKSDFTLLRKVSKRNEITGSISAFSDRTIFHWGPSTFSELVPGTDKYLSLLLRLQLIIQEIITAVKLMISFCAVLGTVKCCYNLDTSDTW